MWISFSTGFPQTDAQQTKPETLLMGTRCRILKTPTLSISMSRFRCWVRSVGFSKIRRSLLFSKHLQFQVKVSDRASIRHKTTSYFMLHFVSGPGLGWTHWIREEWWVKLNFHTCMKLLWYRGFLCLAHPWVGHISIVIFNSEFVSIFCALVLAYQFLMAHAYWINKFWQVSMFMVLSLALITANFRTNVPGFGDMPRRCRLHTLQGA